MLGAPIAIKAMAAKLARLAYRTLRYGIKYVDRHLKFQAASLGYQLIKISAA
jgi:hypothetical protein